MKKDQIYAIVDIESTGGSIGKDRMIQFACVLMKNGEIIETFDTFVNPLKSVPKRIQELTGIHPRELKTAPYFEDIAFLLRNMLEETIFVAHNVGFDFQFLNEEFKRVGVPELTIPAIDTVQLSQVVFPTSNSYALQEIVEWLGYDLDRPHNALFDAEATGFLLNQIDSKLRTLPLTTVEKLAELSVYCIAETRLFFEEALEEMKSQPTDLNQRLIVVEGIAIQDPSISINAYNYRIDKQYPASSLDKINLLDEQYSKRDVQEEMMDSVYHYLKDSSPKSGLAIEAPPGTGKSLGYLLPASFEASPEAPILISTKTTVLQRQMIEESLAYLERLVPFELAIASVKGKYNYLSLANFDYKLSVINKEDIETLFSMRVLVWLTETVTGDIDEIGAGGHSSHDFWSEVRIGRSELSKDRMEKWAAYDFFLRAEKRLKQASIIVTNHAFLVQDWKKEQQLFSNVKKLIIDEAHFFPDVIQDAANTSISAGSFATHLKKLGSQDREQTIIAMLYNLAARDVIKDYQVRAIESNRQLFESEWNDFIDQWISQLSIPIEPAQSIVKWKEQSIQLSNLTISLKRQLKELTRLIYEIVYVGNHIYQSSELEAKSLTATEKFNLGIFKEILDTISEDAHRLKTVFNQNDHADYSWISYYSKHPEKTLRFHRASFEVEEELQNQLERYTHAIYTSSSLSYDGSIDFFRKQIASENIEFIELSSPYHYDEQVRVYVPEQAKSFSDYTKEDFLKYLIDSIDQSVKQTSENALILFKSNDSLQQVYRGLQSKKSLEKKLILAQNLSGTKSKLIKQFKKSKNAILLGADTFWEGVDLPGETLKIVIVTKLPFDSPDQPSVKLRLKKLTDQNQNAFVQDMLPRAVMRLKQGFGRLIRSESDKGVLIVLDYRFLHSSYANVLRQALPKEVEVEKIGLSQMAEKVEDFLGK